MKKRKPVTALKKGQADQDERALNPIMTADTEKIYRLWWEYLRRSKNYKEFCAWMRAKRKDKTLPWPDKFISKKGEGLAPIPRTYLRFGDIHSVAFDEWWKWFRNKVVDVNDFRVNSDIKVQDLSEPLTSVSVQKKLAVKVVSDEFSNAEYFFDRCIASYKTLHGKQPTLQEFKKYFPLWCQDSWMGYSHLFLAVDVISDKPENLAQAIKKLVSQKRKNPTTKSVASRHHSWRPSSYLHLEELKRYLDVYDLRNKKPSTAWANIIQQFSAKANINEDIRTFQLYAQKAKKIIENVEHGHFPGLYDETQTRRVKAKKQ